MKNPWSYLMGLLGGFSIISLPVFFAENFSFHWFTILIYKILALCGLLIFTYFLCKIFRIRFRYGLLLLLVSELSIYAGFMLFKYDIDLPNFITTRFQDVYQNRMRDAAQFNRNIGQYDSDLFYKFQKGNHQFSNIEFTNQFSVNSFGVRDDEKSLNFPKIICLGDSFTMGWGVEQETAFPSLIENQTHTKTLNIGIASYGTAREYLLFQKAKSDSCKLLILQYCENDDVENRNFVENNFSLKISPKEKYTAAQNFNKLRNSYFPLKLSFEFGAKILKSVFKTNENTHPPKQQNDNKRVKYFFQILKLIQQNYDGRIIIFNLESYNTSDLVFQQFKKQLEDFPNQNISLFNASEILAKEDYYKLDDHINEQGHQKIANGITELINKNQMLN